mmetsp:Transcript_24381/g.73156  ORF Transcript_24381/g.73156 Transcript_24381/m.73156 type:complete len:372 (+) Transcript_24381:121-1236(+)
MGGGPHMTTRVLAPGAGRLSAIIFSVMNLRGYQMGQAGALPTTLPRRASRRGRRHSPRIRNEPRSSSAVHLRADQEPRRALPAGLGPVQRVVHGEALGVLGRERVQLRFEQDVRLRLVREDQGEGRRVPGVLERGAGHLVHGRDARAAGHHADGGGLDLAAAVHPLAAAQVLDGADGPLQRDLVAHLERPEVLRHLAAVREAVHDAALVDLDDEVRDAEVVLRRRRRVRALDLGRVRLRVLAAVPLARDDARHVGAEDLHVLAERQPEGHGRRRQLEAEELGVRREDVDAAEPELLPRAVEELGGLLQDHERDDEHDGGERDCANELRIHGFAASSLVSDGSACCARSFPSSLRLCACNSYAKWTLVRREP